MVKIFEYNDFRRDNRRIGQKQFRHNSNTGIKEDPIADLFMSDGEVRDTRSPMVKFLDKYHINMSQTRMGDQVTRKFTGRVNGHEFEYVDQGSTSRGNSPSEPKEKTIKFVIDGREVDFKKSYDTAVPIFYIDPLSIKEVVSILYHDDRYTIKYKDESRSRELVTSNYDRDEFRYYQLVQLGNLYVDWTGKEKYDMSPNIIDIVRARDLESAREKFENQYGDISDYTVREFSPVNFRENKHIIESILSDESKGHFARRLMKGRYK